MSAVFTLIQRQAGYLFRDRGVFAPGGEVLAIGPHIAPLHRAKAAVTARGVVVPGCWPAWVFELTTLEAVVERLPALTAWLHARALSEKPRSPLYAPEIWNVETVLVGWSDAADEAQTWACATAPPGAEGLVQRLPGYAPRVSLRCAPVMGAPSADLPADLLAQLIDPAARETLVAPPVGHSVLTQMRREPRQLPGGGVAHTVAGGVDMATVTPNGVTLDALCDWPDAIGEKVQPSPCGDGDEAAAAGPLRG